MIQPALNGDVFSYVCPHVANVDVTHTALLSVLALSTSLMVALLRNYCRYEAQEKILGYLTRDKHTCKGETAVIDLPLWPWLVHRFGVSGALLSCVMMLSWIVTPVLLALLYRKSLALERRTIELGERLATQNRQQQVERLKREGDRRRPGRRR